MEDMYLSPLPKLRDHWRRGREEGKRQKRWVTIREHYPLDTAGQLYIWTHSSCDITHMTRESLSKTKQQHGEGSWTWNSTSGLGDTGNCQLLERERQFSLSNQVLALGRGWGRVRKLNCPGLPVWAERSHITCFPVLPGKESKVVRWRWERVRAVIDASWLLCPTHLCGYPGSQGTAKFL